MTRHCHNCGWDWKLDGQPGRTNSCHQCKADLRVCLNCVHYDAKIAYQCRERRAEEVFEKQTANYCEYFEMARREFATRMTPDARADAARSQLKKLFGD